MINKGKVFNLGKIKNVNFFSKNKFLLLICTVYLAGIVFSVAFYNSKPFTLNWSGIFRFLYLCRGKYGFIKIYALSLLLHLSVLALFFMSGTSVTGVGTVPAIVFVLGLFMGGITAYLYVTYSLKGIAFNALIILPPAFIFIIVCFIAAKTALEYSVYLSRFILKRSIAGNTALSFKAYGKAFLLLGIALAADSLIDTVLSALFMGLFNF